MHGSGGCNPRQRSAPRPRCPEVPRMPTRCTAVRPALVIAAAFLVTTCSTDTQPAAPRTAAHPDFAVTLSGGGVLVGAGNIPVCDKKDRNRKDQATATPLDGIAGTGFTAGD